MIYDFPYIDRIEPLLKAIEGKPEFIVAEREFFDIINYVVNMEDTFPAITSQTNPKDLERNILLRECRGIAFNKEGFIISRPYHKFHNLNERHETMARLINFNESHIILDKLDGSFLRPLYNNVDRNFYLATKMGLTDVAKLAQEHIANNQSYENLFDYCHVHALTPIFEYCSKENRIVILYTEPKLVLTAIRGLNNGKYMSYKDMVELANKFSIPVVQASGTIGEIDQFLKHSNDIKNIEGFVIRFDTGHMLKIKTEEYCRKHKSADIISNRRQLIELILAEKVDDIKPHLFEDDLKMVAKMETEVSLAIIDMVDRLNKVFYKYKHMDKKNFALNVAGKLQSFYAKGFFSMMDGKEAVDLVKQFLKNNTTTNIKLQNLSEEYGVFVE